MWKKKNPTKEGLIFASNSLGKDGRKKKREHVEIIKAQWSQGIARKNKQYKLKDVF